MAEKGYRPDRASALEENVQAISVIGERNPAGAFESRTGRRLDSSTTAIGRCSFSCCVIRRLDDREWRRDPRNSAFDPFPFPFLAMTVSLERQVGEIPTAV